MSGAWILVVFIILGFVMPRLTAVILSVLLVLAIGEALPL